MWCVLELMCNINIVEHIPRLIPTFGWQSFKNPRTDQRIKAGDSFVICTTYILLSA